MSGPSVDLSGVKAFEENDPAGRRDPVTEAAASFERYAADVLSGLAATVLTNLLDPLRAAFGTAAAHHADLVTRLITDAESEDAHDTEEGARWKAAVDYRIATQRQVLSPIRVALQELALPDGAARAFLEATSRIDTAVAVFPEVIERDEPVESYLPADAESALRKSRKWAIRTIRGAKRATRTAGDLGRRLIRRAPGPPSVHRQTLLFRSLIRFHGASRMVPETGRQLELLLQEVTRQLATLEVETSGWVDVALRADTILSDEALRRAIPGEPGGADAPGEEDKDADIDSISLTLASAAERLQVALETLAAADAGSDLERRLLDVVTTAHAPLADDLVQAGTFMLHPKDRAGEDIAAAATRWAVTLRSSDRWYREVIARLAMDGRLSALRSDLGTLEREFVEHIGAQVATLRERLANVGEAVSAALADPGVSGGDRSGLGTAELQERLFRVRETLTSLLETEVEASIGGEFRQPIRRVADAQVEAVSSTIEALPTEVEIHELAGPSRTSGPASRTIAVRFQAVANQAFDAVLLERLRSAPRPLEAAIDSVEDRARQLSGVIRFNLDAALEELAGEGGSEADRRSSAVELVANGLERTREGLASSSEELTAALGDVRQQLRSIHERGWTQLYDRLRIEHQFQEQIFDLGYRARSLLRAGGVGVQRLSRRAAVRGRKLLRFGRGQAAELVRLGQSAVEGERLTEEAKRNTIDALSTIDGQVLNLPLVYRRLFSFQPVTDPGFLEGRAADLRIIETHLSHWKMGLTDSLVITGYAGTGRTSLLNVLQKTVLQGTEVHRIELTGRHLSDVELAGRLAAVLGLDSDEPWGFDRLARECAGLRRPDRPIVIIVENVEQLLLRTARDNGLVGAFLSLMSRLDSEIFWIATMSEAAWSYIEKVDATRARLVRRHAMGPITRKDLEDIIVNRHARSGLRLHFHPPAAPSPILRRRLNRARNDAERQSILRADYFDRLARATEQNLLLAILYWIRSIAVDADSGTVEVHPVEVLSFGYVDGLSLTQSFSVKALLEHATLTIAEHSLIFHCSAEDSRDMFESLGNLLILEPADTPDRTADFIFTTIDAERRYRIRPLVVHPVILLLRARNLLPPESAPSWNWAAIAR